MRGRPANISINALQKSGEKTGEQPQRTAVTPLAETLRKISTSRSTDATLKLANTVKELINREKDNFGESTNKRIETFNLFAKAFNGKDFALYADMVKQLLAFSPDNIKLLFHSAIYADNAELTEYLLRQDRSLIQAKDHRGFSPYKIALAASAQQVEQLFYARFNNEIKAETRLELDFSQPRPAAAIIKAAFFYEDNSMRRTFDAIIDELYLNPDFRPTLDIIAASLVEERSAAKKSIRIFVANADNVQSLTPKSTGYGDLDLDAIILRLGGKRENQEMKGTLIHEFTHLAALLTYNNAARPYLEGSENERIYKMAISQMDALYHTRVKFNPLEEAISKLLFERMEPYLRREEAHKLKAGALSDPEWVVSIPQAIVLFGSYFESPNISSIESRAAPMLDFWRNQFNVDARNAFRSHPMRASVLYNATSVNIAPQDQTILTTTIPKIKEHIINRRFEVTGGKPTPGYMEGALGQYRIAHQILMGNILDSILARAKLPAEITLADARALAEHAILSSPEYNQTFREIYNLLSAAWIANGKKKTFTIADITPAKQKELSAHVPPQLKNSLQQCIDNWANTLESRHLASIKTIEAIIGSYNLSHEMSEYLTTQVKLKLAGPCFLNMSNNTAALSTPVAAKIAGRLNQFLMVAQVVENAIKAIITGKTVKKDDVAALKLKISDFLYANLPADKNIAESGLASALQTQLLSDNIIKPSALYQIGKLFDKSLHKVQLDDEQLKNSLRQVLSTPGIYQSTSVQLH